MEQRTLTDIVNNGLPNSLFDQVEQERPAIVAEEGFQPKPPQRTSKVPFKAKVTATVTAKSRAKTAAASRRTNRNRK